VAAEMVARQDFVVKDELDEACCNHTMWHGLLGEVTPYPWYVTNAHSLIIGNMYAHVPDLT
jgi:hypothetical protein